MVVWYNVQVAIYATSCITESACSAARFVRYSKHRAKVPRVATRNARGTMQQNAQVLQWLHLHASTLQAATCGTQKRAVFCNVQLGTFLQMLLLLHFAKLARRWLSVRYPGRRAALTGLVLQWPKT
jgi:hypothetical protein